MGSGPKIKAASARYHTRKNPARGPSRVRGGFGLTRVVRMLGQGIIGLLVFSGVFALLSWVAYRGIQPPPPSVCGTPGGPLVTAPRVQLRDGRFLAYKEAGVPLAGAKYKIIATHGYGGSRHALLGGLSEELMKKMRIYVLAYDRAGYGQSTPYPERTVKSEAFDVQDLADGLGLGPTFYLAVTSIGGYTGYSAMKYIPDRLAGVAMFAPVTNFWWKGLPKEKAAAAFDRQVIGDRLALRVAHYAPWLLYWYMTQRVLPTSSTTRLDDSRLDEVDRLRISEYYDKVHAGNIMEPVQQGKYESQFRDMRIMFGTWDEFEPFDLENPFPPGTGVVHIWQGDSDYLVPPVLQREVAKKLPWAQYHEVPDAGHGLLGIPDQADVMIKSLLSS